MINTTVLKVSLSRAATLTIALPVLMMLVSSPVRAGLLDDNEARNAILELRAEARRSHTEQAAQIAALNNQTTTLANQTLALANQNALLASQTAALASQNATLSSQTAALTAQLDKLGAASSGANTELKSSLATSNAQIDALRRNIFELNNTLTQQREDNAKLRGMIEVAGNDITQLQRATTTAASAAQAKLREQEAATDARLKKLEPRAVAIDGKEAVVERAEENNYNGALNQFKAGDYKSASAAFSTFIGAYPQSALLSSAYFWLGSSQYANRDTKQALESLQTFLQKSPAHPRAADAFLTIAHCHNELGDKKRAQTGFTYVIDTYPGTAAADAAKEALPKTAPAPAPAPPKKK